MKIGQLDQRCGECALIEYCAEPYEDLCLCTDNRLIDVDEEDYISLAEQSNECTNEDICEDVINRLNQMS